MGAKRSAEMNRAIDLVAEGIALPRAADRAGVTLSGLCKALKDKDDKKHLRNSNNSTRVRKTN